MVQGQWHAYAQKGRAPPRAQGGDRRTGESMVVFHTDPEAMLILPPVALSPSVYCSHGARDSGRPQGMLALCRTPHLFGWRSATPVQLFVCAGPTACGYPSTVSAVGPPVSKLTNRNWSAPQLLRWRAAPAYTHAVRARQKHGVHRHTGRCLTCTHLSSRFCEMYAAERNGPLGAAHARCEHLRLRAARADACSGCAVRHASLQ